MSSHVQVERVPEIPGDVRFLVLIQGVDERTLVVREDALTPAEARCLAEDIADCPDAELPELLRRLVNAA